MHTWAAWFVGSVTSCVINLVCSYEVLGSDLLLVEFSDFVAREDYCAFVS
jgi:hypothetical protein